jgi:hypothetical protein
VLWFCCVLFETSGHLPTAFHDAVSPGFRPGLIRALAATRARRVGAAAGRLRTIGAPLARPDLDQATADFGPWLATWCAGGRFVYNPTESATLDAW